MPSTLEEYAELDRWLIDVRNKSIDMWTEAMRYYSLHDLFFFVNRVLSTGKITHSEFGTPLFWHDFYLEMCKRNQRYIDDRKSSFSGDSRRAGKSTIRTQAAAIQIALRWPDSAQCIFSVERKLSRRHLRAIKEELETNKLLKALFPDRLWDDPIEATKSGECVWSLEDGLRLKRDRVRAVQTIEQQGYMGGTPTGAGYDVLHFDDAENESVVTSLDMLEKLHESYAIAINLATPAVINPPIIFFTNTIYHPKGIAYQTYERYKAQDESLVSMAPGEDLTKPGDGPLGGTPCYPFTLGILKQKWDEMSMRPDGKQVYAAQICCSFIAGEERTFDKNSIMFIDEDPRDIAQDKLAYICLDASRGQYDSMACAVWANGLDRRHHLVGGWRNRLDPAEQEFYDKIFATVMRFSNWCERVVELRVEQMGSQSWADLIRQNLQYRGVYIPVIPCRGKVEKTGRFANTKQEREWAQWKPPLSAGLITMPKMKKDGGRGILYNDDKGNAQDFVEWLVEGELLRFPKCPTDDAIDAGGLLWDAEVNEDRPLQFPSVKYRRIYSGARASGKRTWMSS